MPALRQAYALFKTAHRSSSRINTLHSKIGFCRRTLSSAAHVLLVGRLCLFSSSLACRASVPSLGIAFPRLPRPSPFLSPGASLQSVFYSKLCPSSPPCPLSSKQLRPSAQRSRGSSALPPSMTSLPASLTRKSGASSRAPTHFLAVKLSSPALHASVAAIQEELIRMYGLSMEKVMVPPSKLHVTLAVLRLEEEEEEGEEGREERHGEEDVGRRTAGGREEERGAGGRIEGDSVHEPVRWKEEDREGADKGNDATPWSHVMAVCGETGRRLMSGKTALANASAASSSALSPSLTPSVSLPTVSQLQTFMSSFMVEMRRSLLNENGGKAPELNFVGLGSFGERVVFVRPCENGQGAQWMQRMVLRLREELFSNGWSVDRAPGSYKDVTLHGTIAKLSKFQKKKGRGRKTKGDMDPPLLGRDVWGMYDEMWASRGVIHNEVCERVQLLRMRGNADGYYECLAEWHFVAEDAKKEEEVDMIR